MANLSQLLPITNNLVTQTDLTTSLASKVTGAAATSSVSGDLKLYEATANGTNYVSFKAPNTLVGDVTWVLPSADGTNGQVLATNGSGTLAWASIASTGVQYTDIGTAPNQIPLNQTLGSMAFQNAAGISVGAIKANGSAQISNPVADISLTVGEKGGFSYYNGIQIWSAYNANYASHSWSQTSGTGTTWTAGASITVNFATGGGGVTLAYNGTSWASASDLRLKNVTGGFDNATAMVDKLRAIKFTWKHDERNIQHVGVSAQSVAEVLPEAIQEIVNPANVEDETKYMAVRYTELIPVLIAAIQELNAEIRKLKGL